MKSSSNRNWISLVFAAVLLISSEQAISQTVKFSTLKGVWLREGYNELFNIGDENVVRVYDLTSISCIEKQSIPVQKFDATNGKVKLNTSKNEITMIPPGEISKYKFIKLPNLPKRYITGETGSIIDPLINFDLLWHTFHENYVFFYLRNIDWYEKYRQLRPKISEKTTEKELFQICNSLLNSLNDGHVSLNTPFSEGSLESNNRFEKFFNAFKAQDKYEDFWEYYYTEVLGKYREMRNNMYLDGKEQTCANNMLFWGRMKDDIGYIEITGMEGYTDGKSDSFNLVSEVQAVADGIDKILKDLDDVKAMIVDIRTNDGGWDAVAMKIANRFTDKRRLAFTKKARLQDGFTDLQRLSIYPEGDRQFTGPVILLTGYDTASAAEIFVMCMMTLPYVTTLGMPTEGILSDQLGKTLLNGWTIGLSNEIYIASDGKLYENTGIPPEIEIPISILEIVEMDHDPVLEKAVEHLKEIE